MSLDTRNVIAIVFCIFQILCVAHCLLAKAGVFLKRFFEVVNVLLLNV